MRSATNSYRTFRRCKPHLRHHQLQIFPGLSLLARVSQQECRMVGDDYFSTACRMPLTAQRSK